MDCFSRMYESLFFWRGGGGVGGVGEAFIIMLGHNMAYMKGPTFEDTSRWPVVVVHCWLSFLNKERILVIADEVTNILWLQG